MISQEAAAFDRRQVTVGLHQALEEKRNAGKGPVRSRRDAARLGAGLIEPAGDDGIEGRVEGLDASDGGVADLGRAHLATPHEIGETEGIVLDIVLGLHASIEAGWVSHVNDGAGSPRCANADQPFETGDILAD
jgi:hypothetical protein